jgi:hypothetical protein
VTLLRPIEFDLARAVAAGPDGARVETTTLLPGGAVAAVSVRLAGGGFRVSDDGLATGALVNLMIHDLAPADFRRGREIADAAGLAFDDEAFFIADVSAGQLPAAVAYVADASRAWVEAVMERRARRAERDLVHRVASRLKERFPAAHLEPEGELMGASTKTHRFDLVMALPGARFAAFQTVFPVSVSIAATHLKFFDLSIAHPEWPREAVVERYSLWRADDLAVMSQVASHIRDLDQAWPDLDSLVLN